MLRLIRIGGPGTERRQPPGPTSKLPRSSSGRRDGARPGRRRGRGRVLGTRRGADAGCGRAVRTCTGRGLPQARGGCNGHRAGTPRGRRSRPTRCVARSPGREVARTDRLRAPAWPRRSALLLDAAKRFEPLDVALARETYLEAFAAAMSAGRLSDDVGVSEVGMAARAAPAAPLPPRAIDLLLDGLVVHVTQGYAAGVAPWRARCRRSTSPTTPTATTCAGSGWRIESRSSCGTTTSRRSPRASSGSLATPAGAWPASDGPALPSLRRPQCRQLPGRLRPHR